MLTKTNRSVRRVCVFNVLLSCEQVLPELSAAFASLADVSHRDIRARACTERVHLLYRQWAESTIGVFEVNR